MIITLRYRACTRSKIGTYMYLRTCMELSTVKTYCDTTPALAILSKPNSHVIPSKGNKTMQALIAALECALTKMKDDN